MLKVIKLIIIFLLVFFAVIGFSLFSGIKIDSFSFGNFSVSQFYLKYDKKLILEVEELKLSLKENDSKPLTTKELQEKFLQIPKILDIFEKIDIEHLKIKDNQFTILINERELYIDNKDINLSAALRFNGPEMDMHIYSLYVKELALTLYGDAKADISKQVVNFFGNYEYNNELEGEINLQTDSKIFDFYVNSSKSIKSLKFLKKFFRLDSVAEAWMYDNVTGDISLNYLLGKIDLEKKEPILNSIKGQVIIEDAKIRFHKDVKTVDTSRLMIGYENDTLSFDLKEPVYNKSKIDGSRVYITDLTSMQKGLVVVDLKTKSMLNEDILEILRAYEINLPLRQKDGALDSKLTLKIPYLASKKMEVDGLFIVDNATLRLNDFEFFAKKADVILKDNEVIIKNSNMIHKNMLDANLDLTIDTKNLNASGKAHINSFKIESEKEKIVQIANLDTNLLIDFKDSAKIDLKALQTLLDVKDEFIEIQIADLSKVYPYSNLLKTIDIKKGDLKVRVYDENRINFFVNAKELDFPFQRNGKKIRKLSALGEINKDKTSIKTNDSDIQIFMEKNKNTLLKLNNIDLLIEDNKASQNKNFPTIDLDLTNSKIILDDEHIYKTQWAKINIEPSKIFFKGKALDLNLPISKNGKKVSQLELSGLYKNKRLDIQTKDKKLKLKYEVPKEKITMDLNGYDVIYNTDQEEDKDNKISYYINGVNSNIIINKKHKALATKYNFIFENYKTDIDLKYNDTVFKYTKDSNSNINLITKNMNDKFLNALFNKELISGGSVDITASGKNKEIIGRADITDSKIIDLAILNNLLIFINTSPGLINPFLAIPSVVGMATSGGFNLNGYRVIEGKVDFYYNFDTKILNMHDIFTKGNGIDFDGYSVIDFDSSSVDAKLKLVFLKNYSKIVGAIPVINYVLLGDEKRVDTQVEIYGTLEEPQYRTKLAQEGVKAPVNVLKRIITSPIELLKSIGGSNETNK